MKDIKGKVAVVTGGGRGIGRGVCLLLAEEGANVRVCKGIYREPAAIAFQDRDRIRENFVALLEILIQASLGHLETVLAPKDLASPLAAAGNQNVELMLQVVQLMQAYGVVGGSTTSADNGTAQKVSDKV